MSTPAACPLGIDIATRSFQVSLLRADDKRRHKAFPTDAAGHHALLAWLTRQDVTRVHACLEATGTYRRGCRDAEAAAYRLRRP